MTVRRLSLLWAGVLVIVVAALAIHRTQAAQRTRAVGQASGPAGAARALAGTVLGGGAPIVASTVTLWATGETGGPTRLAQSHTDAAGRFKLSAPGQHGGSPSVFYVVAKGGHPASSAGDASNDAIGLMTVLGATPPARITINELTTVASVWTSAQFLDGAAISGPALGVRIAADNLPNFVNLETGGYGAAIQDALNSTETPTMANLATLSSLLAGCTTEVRDDACQSLFAAVGAGGDTPKDTLAAAQRIARNPSRDTGKLLALLNELYPIAKGQSLRRTPYMPYLSNAPSAWTLPLKFTGGGLSGPGKLAFDAEGNLWTGDNFIVGSQARDALWDGNLSEIAPNGKPLSPMTTGFTGGGVLGPGFGTAVAADGTVWIDSTIGRTISHFDRDGKPLSPPGGYNFGGQLGLMQGIIVAPDGDVWALDFEKDQVVHLPGGDPARVQFLCRSNDGKPNKDSPCKLNGAFHLAIDQQDRIWITSVVTDTVTRFPAADPSKVEVFKLGGHSGKGMAIDSKGNAWITNTLGSGLKPEEKAKLLALKLTDKTQEIHRAIVDYAKSHRQGNITMLQPDGNQAPGGSTFTADGALWAPWGVAIDGNDQVWISTLVGSNLVRLCGASPETCPSGMKTGDPISPSSGYVGGGMQWLTDVAIDPAGDVWVADNWQNSESCFGNPPEAESTRCGGNGLTVFYGMARPVRTPQIGPPRTP